LFHGKSVIKPDGSSTYLTNTTISPALFLDGTRPYLYMIARFPSIGANKYAVRSLNTANSQGGPSFRCDTSNSINIETWGPAPSFTDTASPHWFECGFTSAGVTFVGIDGARSTTGTGQSILGDRTKLGVGSGTGASNYQALMCAGLVACNAVPSAAQVTDVVAIDRATWGF
jgi:hypothetical protein